MDRSQESDKMAEIADTKLDPTFEQEVQKLHEITVWGRWLLVGFLWITIAPLCLWNLRSEIALLQQHFTWSTLKYGLAYNKLPTIGLALCYGMTAAVLIWQSRNILWGMPPQEKRRLEKQVNRIRQQGASHPLWKWVCLRSAKIKI